jgi:hypothetical protein
MKQFLVLSLVLFSTDAFAIHFRVEMAKDQAIFIESEELSLPVSAGEATVHFLNKGQDKGWFRYEGTAEGIRSIAGLGTGVERISNTEIRAYGWCYTVDGFEPSVMPDQYLMENQDATILWFYAYSTLKDDVWINQCVPFPTSF